MTLEDTLLKYGFKEDHMASGVYSFRYYGIHIQVFCPLHTDLRYRPIWSVQEYIGDNLDAKGRRYVGPYENVEPYLPNSLRLKLVYHLNEMT